MALTTLVLAAAVRLIWLSSRAATATPAASSDGLTLLDPELSRDNDLASMSWLAWRFEAAASAWMFVLMTISSCAGCYVRACLSNGDRRVRLRSELRRD